MAKSRGKKFIDAEETNQGEDVIAETYYKEEVTNKFLKTDLDATQAAIYDESALDPYERRAVCDLTGDTYTP